MPAGATVLSASMEFWSNNDKGVVVDVGAVTSNWTEGDGTNEQDATWLEALTGVPWTSAGGDFGSALGSFTQDNKDEWDVVSGANVTTLTQNWVDGTTSNFGVILISDGSVDKEQGNQHQGRCRQSCASTYWLPCRARPPPAPA